MCILRKAKELQLLLTWLGRLCSRGITRISLFLSEQCSARRVQCEFIVCLAAGCTSEQGSCERRPRAGRSSELVSIAPPLSSLTTLSLPHQPPEHLCTSWCALSASVCADTSCADPLLCPSRLSLPTSRSHHLADFFPPSLSLDASQNSAFPTGGQSTGQNVGGAPVSSTQGGNGDA